MKGSRALSVIVGILMVIAGFYCISAPAIADVAIIWIMIGTLLVCALANIFTWNSRRKRGEANAWNLVGSILSFILAIILIVNVGARFASLIVLMYMVTAWMFIMGIIRIITAVKMKNLPEFRSFWVLTLIMGILMVVASLSGLARPLGVALAIGLIIGINFVVCGFSYIFGIVED